MEHWLHRISNTLLFDWRMFHLYQLLFTRHDQVAETCRPQSGLVREWGVNMRTTVTNVAAEVNLRHPAFPVLLTHWPQQPTPLAVFNKPLSVFWLNISWPSSHLFILTTLSYQLFFWKLVDITLTCAYVVDSQTLLSR